MHCCPTTAMLAYSKIGIQNILCPTRVQNTPKARIFFAELLLLYEYIEWAHFWHNLPQAAGSLKLKAPVGRSAGSADSIRGT